MVVDVATIYGCEMMKNRYIHESLSVDVPRHYFKRLKIKSQQADTGILSIKKATGHMRVYSTP